MRTWLGVVGVLAILDERGRVRDLHHAQHRRGDAFEREGDSRDYPLEFSVEGYAPGGNVLLHPMTR